MKTLVLVGAKPSGKLEHPGGQLTASIGIIKFVQTHTEYKLQVIDTTQSSFPVPSFFSRLAKGVGRTSDLVQILSKEKVAGVIIFSSSGFSFYERSFLALFCRLFKVKVVFFMRSGHFIESVNRSLVHRYFASALLRIPNVIGAQGENWREFYNRLGVPSDSISIVRNWLPPGFVPIDNPKRFVGQRPVKFVYVGWLVEKKGVIELLRAVSKFTDHTAFSLTLIGGGTLYEYCRGYIDNNNLKATVELLGWCEHEDVAKTLDASDVFILPSRAEGFPNAMLEAMGKGLPVIATDVGGVSDSLINEVNGFLLEQGDEYSIYSAMKRYISDPSLIEQHSRASIDICQRRHSYRDNCHKLISLFQ